MRTTIKRRSLATLATLATASLVLAACGSDTGDGGKDGTADAAGGGDISGTITMGFLPAWTDGLSMAYLLQNQLEEMGYTVDMQTLTEAAPLYAAVAKGDVNMYPSAWPEVTHVDYMKEFGDDIEDLGAYYANAKLTIAVPDYVDITSLDELADNADMFGGKIIGIEPGAGLTRVTSEEMMPAYDLTDSYELVTSSTTAMLSELKGAVADEKPIVVTLWRPFWANSAFPVRDLEDPKGAMGEAEGLHFLANKGFAEEFPEAAEWISQVKLDDDQYGSLEDMVVNEYGEGKEAEAVQAWLEQNPDVLPALPGSE